MIILNKINSKIETKGRIVKLALGDSHSIALSATNRFFVWGSNARGQLGDGTLIDKIVPTDITDFFPFVSNEKIIKISAGGWHTAVLSSLNQLYIWGFYQYRQLASGNKVDSSSPVNITNNFELLENEKIIDVSLGGYNSSLITSFGRVFTWGDNEFGNLGGLFQTMKQVSIDITKNFKLEAEEKLEKIYLRNNHSAAITSLKRVFTWGVNASGQLGNGSFKIKKDPTDITKLFNLEDHDYIISLALGDWYSFALSKKGKLFGFGNNEYCQLGVNTFKKNIKKPLEITLYLGLFLDEKVVQVVCGKDSTAVLTSKNRIITFGRNKSNQLGYDLKKKKGLPYDITTQFGLKNDFISSIYSGNNHFGALTVGGKVLSWGKQ